MSLDKIKFSYPEIVPSSYGVKYVRKWKVPSGDVGIAFWSYWKENKIRMLARDFTVAKSKRGDWELIETKANPNDFKEYRKRPELKMESSLKLKDLSDNTGLREFQIPTVQQLVASIREHGAALDGSDTGCHAKGQEILMFDGSSKKVEDIVVGDTIMGWDSTGREVVDLKRGNQEMVRILPKKGNPWTVNKDHILTLKLTNGPSPSHKHTGGFRYGSVVDVKVGDYLKLSRTTKHAMKLFTSGKITCWETKNLPVDPYLLGILLGDGGMTLRSTVTLTSVDSEIWEFVEEYQRLNGGTLGGASEDITKRFTKSPILFESLRSLKLFPCHGRNKFVPEIYKTSDINQRSQILAGLIDSDGWTENCEMCFCSQSKRLRNDVSFLARSLGMFVVDKEGNSSCVYKGETKTGYYYSCRITGDTINIPVKIPRKLPNKRKIKKQHNVFGFDLEILTEDDYFGFEITGDGRYLLGDFTVTHNTGKTYSAIGVARELGRKVGVICPKSVIESWKRVITNHFGMEYEFVLNYEALKGNNNNEIISKVRKERSLEEDFFWNIPKNTLLIFDESHRLKGQGTLNSEMAKAARRQRFTILCCSATNAINPMELDAVGYILGLHKSGLDFYKFLRRNDCDKSAYSWQFNGSDYVLKKLHKDIFLNRGARLVKDEIPGFPESEIITEPYSIEEGSAEEINRLYFLMNKELEELKKKTAGDIRGMEMTIRLRGRQKIELLKVPLLIEMVEDLVEEGNSVVVMVNFTETIKSLSKKLNIDCIVWGENKGDERQGFIDDFQADKQRVILVNTAAGGVGVSLHDLHGNHPRVALISPNDSAPILRQAFGRVHRDGAKTKSQQRVIFIANTVEEDVCNNVKMKLNNLDLINDGDLDPSIVGMLRE